MSHLLPLYNNDILFLLSFDIADYIYKCGLKCDVLGAARYHFYVPPARKLVFPLQLRVTEYNVKSELCMRI